jgi:hypothetical protein
MYVVKENLRDVISDFSKKLSKACKEERKLSNAVNKYDFMTTINAVRPGVDRNCVVDPLRNKQKEVRWLRNMVRCLTIALGIMNGRPYNKIEDNAKHCPDWNIIRSMLSLTKFNERSYPYDLPWKITK